LSKKIILRWLVGTLYLMMEEIFTMPIRIHYFQHVPYEGLGSIGDWAEVNRHPVTVTRFYEDAVIPADDAFDLLIVMGGPMNVDELSAYPWLASEKAAIDRAIVAGKPVLGICLGAQLIARVLGAAVKPNAHREIGWFPVHKQPDARGQSLSEAFPDTCLAFHWHGDTFDLPPGARHLAASEACAQQGFIFGDRVVGLQFHLEMTFPGAESLLAHCIDDLKEGPYVQTSDAIRTDPAQFEKTHAIMDGLMDRMAAFLQ